MNSLKNRRSVRAFSEKALDFNRIGLWCLQHNATPGFDNIQALAYAAIDTVIVAQTFRVAAEEAGLGICYLGRTVCFLMKPLFQVK